jgi:hypothetical protein
MDLGDGSRRYGRHIKNCESLLERFAGALLDHLADLRNVQGRHVILHYGSLTLFTIIPGERIDQDNYPDSIATSS